MDQPRPGARPGKPRDWGPSFHIVGVGASAGGLEALERFFNNMRPDSGLAFVVIQHLSPDFKSLMDELLRRHTDIAIRRVEDGMQVEPNSIYLIPPKKEMIISGGKLLLTDKDPKQGLSLPIDTFFRSLAQDAGDMAIGIVLSGTGSDGSRGIREIHEAGGLVIVQNVESAKFDGMPRSAIDTGVVDAIMAPEEIPAALLNYIAQPPGARFHAASEDLPSQDAMQVVIRLLREQYGIDFSNYKPNTVTRRIERRLLLNQSLDLDAYAERLIHDPAELNALYKDLLIGVTKFFRDREAFERLEKEIVPNLVNRGASRDEIRVWVAGCATGEEAYSIAILLHEQLQASGRQQDIKIFATDVHRASLDFASAGIYDEQALSEVPPARLDRYFVRHGNAFRVVPDLRRMIVFAPHNVIKDAPFTKMDLITCRNLLIYLNPPAQKKVLSLFLFGLRTRGILFLGPSESPGDLAPEFDTLDNQWKLYRKRRDVGLPADMRFPLSSGLVPPATPATRGSVGQLRPTESGLVRIYDAVLERHMPPSLLVNERQELVHCFGHAGRYLTIRDGRHSTDVLDLLHEDLRTPLAGALQRSATQRQPVIYRGIRVGQADAEEYLSITVEPLTDDASGILYNLVTLESMSRPVVPKPDADEIDMGQATREHLESLETELRYTKENLQATIEEMETSNEELQATNEELVASNEELQSTNEELHSVNEELYTVNAEYQRKIAELEQMTNDMDNLMHSTEIGVMFLDRDLCIRKFTAKVGQFFDLLPQDVGRRISTFAHSISHDGLLRDVQAVLETECVSEREVWDARGAWHLLRILPYREKSRTVGVVLTIVDISTLKQVEQQLRRMSKVFMDGADPIIVEDLSGRILDLNAEAERVYGWNREELLGQSIEILVPASRRAEARRLRTRCRNQEHVRNVEAIRQTKSGKTLPVLLTLSLLTQEAGEPVAIATIAKDIKRLKDAERDAREAVRRRDQFLAMLSHELRNPLAAVTNAGRLLDRGDCDPSVARQARHVINRQTAQMTRLLEDLLDVARVTQGKIRLRQTVCDVASLVDDAVESVRARIEERGHELHTEVVDRPLYVRGDGARLLQIQTNLLSNAAKYTPPDGRISLTVTREDRHAVIRVCDNGRGIPAHMLESVFDLFVQTDDPLHRDEGGLGVGLTLVRQLVELHGGQVTARSEGVGKGSEFVVRLPLTEERPRVAAPSTAGQPNGERRRVLIVEDNPDSREMLQCLLELDGHQVMTAGDGAAGLQAIAAQRPDVALIDLGLPEIDGYEVARRIRADRACRSVRLVALTGYGRDEDRQAVLEAGFDAHLVKPIQPDDLSRVLASSVS